MGSQGFHSIQSPIDALLFSFAACEVFVLMNESFLCVAFVCLTLTLFLVLVYFHTNTKTKDVLGIKRVSFTDTFILRSAYF